jgi:hypothetical protein
MKKTIATPPGQDSKHVEISKEERRTRKREESAYYLKRAKKQYKLDRRDEYPPIEDQLDMIYHQGLPTWKKAIKAIKDKYPKDKE